MNLPWEVDVKFCSGSTSTLRWAAVVTAGCWGLQAYIVERGAGAEGRGQRAPPERNSSPFWQQPGDVGLDVTEIQRWYVGGTEIKKAWNFEDYERLSALKLYDNNNNNN